MKVSEAKKILTLMAGENEVSLESVLAVVDMIDDLESEPKAQSPLLPLPKNTERKLREIEKQPLTEEDTEILKEQETAAAPGPRKAPRKKEPTKDSCRNCFYASKSEITYEDGSKHPGRKCSKDGRTHSDDGICGNHLRRGKKPKETA